MFNDDQLQAMYLDWVNNFLTVARFAAYYEMSDQDAKAVIDRGREVHEQRVAELKANPLGLHT